MSKDLRKIVFGTVLGFSVLLLLLGFGGLLLTYLSASDILEIYSKSKYVIRTVLFVKWTCLSLFFVMIPTMLFIGAGWFTKSKLIKIGAAALSVATVSLIIVFMCVPTGFAKDGDGSSEIALAALTSYQSAMLSVLIPLSALCVACVVAVVNAFLHKPDLQAEGETAL